MKKLYLILFIFCSSVVFAQPSIEWISRYSASGTTGTGKNNIALDKLGNTFIFGGQVIPGHSLDFLTFKLNQNGDTIWTRLWGYEPISNEINRAMVCDSIGNVYISGYIYPQSGPWKIVTIKYSPQGFEQWVRIYSAGFNISCLPYDIKLDHQGNAYVVGFSDSTTLLIKYNSVGDSLWVRRFTWPGFEALAVSVTVDNQNNAYICGVVNWSILVMKYDPNGNLLWYDAYAITGFYGIKKIVSDNLGDVFVLAEGGVNHDYITIKYTDSGNRLWTRYYSGPPNQTDQPYDMVCDRFGNVIVTGASTGINTGNFDYATVKYNTNGDSLWVRRYNGTGNANDEAYSLAVDDSGNAYVTGRSIGTQSNWDYATIKYYTNGNTAWVVRYSGINGSGGIGYGIAVDGNRNVYVTGISDSASHADYITIKYSQLVGLIPINSETPQEFYLSQNYPNPFNPKSNIKFQIAQLSDAKLTVFDLLGREIAVPVNQKLTPGTYEIGFDGSSYPSGVYFYLLFVNNKLIDAKKMVLVK